MVINKTLLIAALLVPLAAHAQHDGGKLARFLTPEQRAMLVMQSRDDVKDMAPDERKTFRRDEIARLMGMTDNQRVKVKADLQAKWDALPQKRKDRIEARISAHNDRRLDKRQGLNADHDSAVVK